MEKLGMLKLDLYVAFVCFLFPLGWSMSGFQPNIVLACACWGVALGLLLHALWIYEKTAKLPIIFRVILTLAVIAIVVSLAWSPVVKEYQKEHFVVDSARFINILKAQSADRYRIRIGCAPTSEEACVVAGHFLDFFREAGWLVEGNSVQRTMLGKPEAGILLFLHGAGTIDPTNPRSGLWVLQSDSLNTIRRAFREIRLRAGERADSDIPQGVIAVYFGYNPVTP
jgi:hypothetical protein